VGIARIDYAQLNSGRRSCGLDHGEKSNGGVAKDGYARRLWRELLEQFKPFAAYVVFRTR
jgi:hypothetical protein